MKEDIELQQDVMEEIKWDPQLKDIASEIGVAAKDGVVTLSGIVDSYARKLAAEKAAQRVHGVKVVAVDLEVKIAPTTEKTDAEIATAVKNALTWHTAVNEDQIEIKVDEGWVYLDGTVEWDYMKKAAEKAISDLIGVRGVTNRINVSSKAVESSEVKRRITAAFHRSASIDSSNVHVEVAGGHVILTGKVRTWAERQDAENAAWTFPGVVAVDNQIEIDTMLLVDR
jgi:osmotically-inducible protein OsmY